MRRSIGKIVASTLALATALLGADAMAQQAAATVASDEDEDTIIVTATRRETALQETAASVTAFNAEAIERLRVQDLDDTLQQIPNATLIEATGSSGTYPSIRGSVTSDDAPAVDMPVSFFIDDIYFGSGAAFAQDLFDVGQIEVLRGPQGTTFGRNVVGGAIIIQSARPTFETEGMVSGTLRSQDGYELRGMVNVPVVDDRTALRFSASRRKADGWATNVPTGGTVGDTDVTSVRGQFRAKATEDLELRLGVSYSADRGGDQPFQYFFVGNGSQLFPQLGPDPDITQFNDEGGSKRDLVTAVGRADWEIGDLTLVSISAYRDLDTRFESDVDATPLRIIEQSDEQREKQWSQELRLVSPERETGLEWIAGAYYLHQDNVRDETFRIDSLAGTLLDAADPFTRGAPVTTSTNTQEVKLNSLAPYAEGVIRFTPQIALRLGARYTIEEKKGRTIHAGQANLFTGAIFNAPFKEDWSSFTPRAVVELKPSEDLFFYAGATKGFKSGGFSLNNNTAASAVMPFEPEKVVSYEAGVRSTWLDKALTLNATVFRAETDDLQVRAFNGLIFVITNAAESRSTGVEVEAVARPFDGLTLRGAYGYIDAEFKSFPACSRVAGVVIDCSGRKVPFTPKTTVSLGSTYEVDTAVGNFAASGNVLFRSGYHFNFENTGPLKDESKVDGLISANLAWTSTNGRLGATLWGKNLTDQRNINFGTDLGIAILAPAEVAGGEQGFRVNYNAGRSYGVTLKYNF